MPATIQTPERRPRRADARRNRERVVAAAFEVFAEKGLDAGVPEIAARAGVGKATVYRSFPSKEHLVAAVAVERLEWFAGLVDDALEDADAGAALQSVLLTSAEAHCGDQAVAAAIAASIDMPDVQRARAEVGARLDRLIGRAQEQGTVRRDVGWADVRVLFGGVTTALREAGERDPGVWRRYVGLVLDALRP